MSEPYIRPVLDAAIEIMKETLNTKINEISINGLSEPPKDVDDSMYHPYLRIFGEDYPSVSVALAEDGVVDSEEETGHVITITLGIVTEIEYQAEDEEELAYYGDIYLTAMIRSLTAGTGSTNVWTFNNTVLTVTLDSMALTPFTGEEEDQTIIGGCHAVWHAEISADPAGE